jgi:transposase, IS5 family
LLLNFSIDYLHIICYELSDFIIENNLLTSNLLLSSKLLVSKKTQRFLRSILCEKIIDLQPSLFCPTIDQIKFDLHSRDEIPQLLMGLQAIYTDKEVREAIFELLMQLMITKNIDPGKGRKGMDLWTIFVLENLRLNCYIDFDKLHELANEHRTLRMIIGHGPFDDKNYPLQTIKDNVSLLSA